YNNQPNIYDILNNEDPVIEGPIDTDALVKDIFDTDLNNFTFPPSDMMFESPVDMRRHSVSYFNPQHYQPASRTSTPFGNNNHNTPPTQQQLHPHHQQQQQRLQQFIPLDTVIESSPHRASLPNIFLSDTSRRQLNTSIQQRFDRKRFYPQDCPLPMSGVASRRSSIASPNDICTWNKMVDEETSHKKSRLEIQEDNKDYPVITEADLEAAKIDPNAIPRKQKLRYEGDGYTPKWVRYTGQSKEGYCDTCRPGKWLQLKNSAYWYHKQFFHGISSVSGKEFQKPLEQRAGEHDVIEGLCHQCRIFVPICNSKRKNSVLWYRHAHKCHIYDKPKSNKRVQVPPPPAPPQPPKTHLQPIY
ncbi:uncharacterized protein EV154DRAFT_152814, partial [Mucor mucedo]|uniref:uncharacterized protein n=1 Tax=Mucor mucedo TaxID=29922 RepID=UPI00221FBB43